MSTETHNVLFVSLNPCGPAHGHPLPPLSQSPLLHDCETLAACDKNTRSYTGWGKWGFARGLCPEALPCGTAAAHRELCSSVHGLPSTCPGQRTLSPTRALLLWRTWDLTCPVSHENPPLAKRARSHPPAHLPAARGWSWHSSARKPFKTSQPKKTPFVSYLCLLSPGHAGLPVLH